MRGVFSNPFAGMAVTGADEMVNRAENPSVAKDARSLASVAAAGAPMLEGLESMSKVSPKVLAGVSKVPSFIGMMEGIGKTLTSGADFVRSFKMTGLDASNDAHRLAFDGALKAGKSLEEAGEAGAKARMDVLDKGWDGMKTSAPEVAVGLWTAGYNGVDLVQPAPIGSLADITVKMGIKGMVSISALPQDQQVSRMHDIFFEDGFGGTKFGDLA